MQQTPQGNKDNHFSCRNAIHRVATTKFFAGFAIALLMGINVYAAQSQGNTPAYVPANSVSEIVEKGEYPLSQEVSATEFNSIVDTIRGIVNYFDGTNHFWGINKNPVAGVGLDLAGALQLGTTADVCDANFAGSLQFKDSHFVYCDGADWRPLDTADCSVCGGVDAFEYTCTDDGVDGAWTGGTEVCETVDYDNSGEIYYVYTDVVCATADPAPNDDYCGIVHLLCEALDTEYETRCIDGNIKWFDDCGKETGDFAGFCNNGCTNTVAVDGNGVAIPLPDGANSSVHPMHPQYTTNAACVGDEVGCDTGYNWADPYTNPNEPYYAGATGVYDSPRIPNHKFAGICNEHLACGSAELLTNDDMPPTDIPNHTGLELCEGTGTLSVENMTDGWQKPVATADWEWICSNEHGQVPCTAPHIDWKIKDWGSCLNGRKSREVFCWDSLNGSYAESDCLTAGAGDGYIGEQIMANAYLGDGLCYSSGAAGADAELPNRLCFYVKIFKCWIY